MTASRRFFEGSWYVGVVWLVLAVMPQASAEEIVTGATVSADAGLPSIGAIKACSMHPRQAVCLDDLFREALKTHSTHEVLQLIARFEAEDIELRRDCHPVVHAIGRETFRLKHTIHDSFEACDQTCHSGCYHGSVERFLLGDADAQVSQHPTQAELRIKAASACDPKTPYRLRFQCLHGLGHAVMYFAGYDLSQALGICDALPDDWSKTSCYGGIFMENVFNATNEKKNFHPTDYHYPCDTLAFRYRSECYMMQTTRMKEMGLSTEGMIAECAKAGAFKKECTQSIGRDLSNTARSGDPRTVSAACETAPEEGLLACMGGVIYALIDNTWDGRYAFPFCRTFKRGEDRDTCFKSSVQYMKVLFDRSVDDISKDCKRYAPDSPRCMELAARKG